VGAYGGADGTGEGMDDMEQAPVEEGTSSGGKFGEEQSEEPKKRKKQPSSMATLDSKASFSVVKKDKKHIELLDYDKMAQIDNQLLYSGMANIQGEDFDPNALLEPHE
jgi:hypothetical protein